MYHLKYAETMSDDEQEARGRERQAFDIVIAKLQQAERTDIHSKTSIEALFYAQRLWMFLMEDLTDSQNALPEKLRADLISIGIWVLKECERISIGEIDTLSPLLDLNIIIRRGLDSRPA